jgi:tripartite-type tricarboxylate transporter receptor subunit TctC
MEETMRHLGTILISSILLTSSAQAVSAQDKYPSRPIKVLVPYAPGGATDITARLVGDEFQKITGQGFVVLNKPGANGLLAIDELVKSDPDGYTVMIGNVSTNAITPILYKSRMSYDYTKSVVAVTNLVDVPAFLLVTTANDFAPKTVKELIDYAKKNPGKLRYGHVGPGSYPHYDFAYFAKKAGELDVSPLPNKNGASGVIQDMLRGDAEAAFLNTGSTAGNVQAGKFRALAVVNHARLEDYPNVPTMKEVGFPEVGTIAWNGLFAPAGTPKPVLDALHAAATKAVSSAEAQAKLKKQNFNVVPSKSVEDAQKWLAAEMKQWETITSEVKVDITQ